MRDAANAIRLSDIDFQAISGFLETLSPRQLKGLRGLEAELARAEIVPAAQMPADVVAMYSTVIYEDLRTGRVAMVQITYPEDADITQGRVSVLAPVGAALLGLKIGQEIEWPLPDGRIGKLRVKQLVQRPGGSLADTAS